MSVLNRISSNFHFGSGQSQPWSNRTYSTISSLKQKDKSSKSSLRYQYIKLDKKNTKAISQRGKHYQDCYIENLKKLKTKKFELQIEEIKLKYVRKLEKVILNPSQNQKNVSKTRNSNKVYGLQGFKSNSLLQEQDHGSPPNQIVQKQDIYEIYSFQPSEDQSSKQANSGLSTEISKKLSKQLKKQQQKLNAYSQEQSQIWMQKIKNRIQSSIPFQPSCQGSWRWVKQLSRTYEKQHRCRKQMKGRLLMQYNIIV